MIGSAGGRIRLYLMLILLFSCLFSACLTIPESTLSSESNTSEKRSSSAITITLDGKTLLVTNPDSNSLSLVDTAARDLVEIPVGLDPRTVSVDASGRLAATANRKSGSISLINIPRREVVGELQVGALPWGVVLSTDGRTAYVACEGAGWIAVVDTRRQELVAHIPVEDRPTGLALSQDGKRLYVTHLLTARVSVIDLESQQVEQVIPTWLDGNLAQSIVLNPYNAKAYLPLTRSNTTNPRLSFDTTVFPLVTVVDLDLNQMIPQEIISLPEADQPVGLPYDAAFSPNGNKLYVINAASNDLSIINMDTGMGLGHLSVGQNPRGIVISPDGNWAYVNNTLSGTVSVIDIRTDLLVEEIPVTQIPLPPAILEGKRVFHASQDPELSRQAWISCNTCHWEGEQDGRVWTFSFSGPRNTTSLLGMINTYPLRWSAEWDESADSEFAITMEQFGIGFLGGEMHPPLGDPNTGRSQALDSLALFIDSLAYLPNFQKEGLEPDLISEGQRIFYDQQIGCDDCHSGPYYTDYLTHDVGTADNPAEILGPLIDTPSLLSLGRSAPYLHDGSAPTLLDVVKAANPKDLHGVTSQLTQEELEALVVFMVSLDMAGNR